MRGPDIRQAAMFSYLTLERRIPAGHPLRAIRRLTDRPLERIGGELDKLYAPTGRESIPPERLLRALLLMVLYSVRSERQLMEQLNYNRLFRWLADLEMDDEVWDVTVFTQNRERLIEGEVSQRLLGAVLAEAREKPLLSAEPFSVEGTLIQAWAARRSLQEKSDPPAPRPGMGTGRRSAAARPGGIEDRPRRTALQEGDSGQERAKLPGSRAEGEPPRSGGGHASESVGHGGGMRGGAEEARPSGETGGAACARGGDHAGGRHAVSRREVYRRAAGARCGPARQ
ncbi:MAG: transposase [Terriglobia bacterium]